MDGMTAPKVLLIDNTFREGGKVSDRITLLEEIYRSYPAVVRTVHYKDIEPESAEGVNAIVLSGSSMNMSEDATKEMMRPIVDLVWNTSLPVLGICFGFHLVMHSFGCTVMRNELSGEFLPPDGKLIEI